jgi:hypothetical protein
MGCKDTMMRTSFVNRLTFIWWIFPIWACVRSTPATANPGQEIGRFLTRVTKGLPVELYRLEPSHSVRGPCNVVPEPKDFGYDNQLRLVSHRCSSQARQALSKALVVAPLPEPGRRHFRPDYCIVYREPEESTTILWVDSTPSELQMQLQITSRMCPVDVSGIRTEPPSGPSGVGDALRDFWRAARAPYNDMTGMVKDITELLSVDPQPVSDIFQGKRWKVLGKVALDSSDLRNVQIAVSAALDPFGASSHTALAFTPRLAASAWIPADPSVHNARRQHYLLLMSFECRLAELYVDGELHGCCALNVDWKLKSGVALGVSPDQILNKILGEHSIPLKPKSTSSGS